MSADVEHRCKRAALRLIGNVLRVYDKTYSSKAFSKYTLPAVNPSA